MIDINGNFPRIDNNVHIPIEIWEDFKTRVIGILQDIKELEDKIDFYEGELHRRGYVIQKEK